TSIVPIGLAGFSAMKALSTRNAEPERAWRPFDRDRDGFVMSEGAGVVIVEELEHAKARGAKIYCELAGYGLSAGAYHMTARPVRSKPRPALWLFVIRSFHPRSIWKTRIRNAISIIPPIPRAKRRCVWS